MSSSVASCYEGCALVVLDVQDSTPRSLRLLYTAARAAAAEHRPALVVDLACAPDRATSLVLGDAEHALARTYVVANEGLVAARAEAPGTELEVIVLPPVVSRASPRSYVPATLVVDGTAADSTDAFLAAHRALQPSDEELERVAARVPAQTPREQRRLVCDCAVECTCLGGTFDRLHAGHRLMLALGVLLTTKTLFVGVTDVSMLRSKRHKDMIQSYDQRCQQLHRTLWLMHPGLTYRFEPLLDPAGPAQRTPEIRAIVVSGETVRGADLINARRAELNMPPLSVFVVSFVPPPSDVAADALGKLSSSSLRSKELAQSSLRCKAERTSE